MECIILNKKIYTLIILIILLTPFIFANEEVQISCGGNNEVQINCLGDKEISFWGSLPSKQNQISQQGIQNYIAKIYNYSYVLLIVVIIAFLIFLLYRRRKYKI